MKTDVSRKNDIKLTPVSTSTRLQPQPTRAADVDATNPVSCFSSAPGVGQVSRPLRNVRYYDRPLDLPAQLLQGCGELLGQWAPHRSRDRRRGFTVMTAGTLVHPWRRCVCFREWFPALAACVSIIASVRWLYVPIIFEAGFPPGTLYHVSGPHGGSGPSPVHAEGMQVTISRSRLASPAFGAALQRHRRSRVGAAG